MRSLFFFLRIIINQLFGPERNTRTDGRRTHARLELPEAEIQLRTVKKMGFGFTLILSVDHRPPRLFLVKSVLNLGTYI